MKLNKIFNGMRVVLNKEPDAQIYRVEGVIETMVQLSYFNASGRKVFTETHYTCVYPYKASKDNWMVSFSPDKTIEFKSLTYKTGIIRRWQATDEPHAHGIEVVLPTSEGGTLSTPVKNVQAGKIMITKHEEGYAWTSNFK